MKGIMDIVAIFGFTTAFIVFVLMIVSRIGPMTGFLALFILILFLLAPLALVFYIVWVLRSEKFGLRYKKYLLGSLLVFLLSLGVLWLISGGCGGILDACGLLTGVVVMPSFFVLASILMAPLWWRVKKIFKK